MFIYKQFPTSYTEGTGSKPITLADRITETIKHLNDKHNLEFRVVRILPAPIEKIGGTGMEAVVEFATTGEFPEDNISQC